MTTEAPSLPAGLLMPMTVRDIGGGKLYDNLNMAIADIHAAMTAYVEKTGDTKGAKTKVTLVVELSPTPDMENHTDINWHIKSIIPTPKSKSYAKTQDGVMLADATPDGVRRRAIDEEQIELFNNLGASAGSVDTETLTMLADHDETAGKISNAS